MKKKTELKAKLEQVERRGFWIWVNEIQFMWSGRTEYSKSLTLSQHRKLLQEIVDRINGEPTT